MYVHLYLKYENLPEAYSQLVTSLWSFSSN